MKKFNAKDLHAYLESYYVEASSKDEKADKEMETQDIKTGEETSEVKDSLEAPMIYSHIAWALKKNDISQKKIVSILQDVGEANDDRISEELAEKILQAAAEKE